SSIPGLHVGAAGGCADAAAGALEDVRIKIVDGFGKLQEDRDLVATDVLREGDEVRKLHVIRLPARGDDRPARFTPRRPNARGEEMAGHLDDASWAVQAFSTTDRLDSGSGIPYYQALKAGPRQSVHWDGTEPGACAVILTCGGLCPGENVVIRGIVHALHEYGVQSIYGIRNGFSGIVSPGCWTKLSLELVQDIHTKGGTVLASERSFPAPEEMAKALKARKVQQLFMLGGDGAHKGLLRLIEPLLKDGYQCSCVGVPSTVNNDIPMVPSGDVVAPDGWQSRGPFPLGSEEAAWLRPEVEKTFGFDSAVTEARDSIDAAYVEATCNANCIGLVKLLGRDSGLLRGFLALTATLASRHVDICLLPEMESSVEKVCDHCERLMSTKGYAVIVVADGWGRSSLLHG
ncbi:unnamed protein product, partial [Prorocentrum cordatum]